MLIKVKNSYVVSVEVKLSFRGKLDYILNVLQESSKNFNTDVDEIENSYYSELGDQIDFSNEDYEFHQSQVEVLKNEAKHFPQILFKSMLVSGYSVFETTMSEIRVDSEKQVNRKIKYKHLKTIGSEIENIIHFFHIIHDCSFSDLTTELSKLKDYNEIRNIIVHKNGNIKQEDMSVKNRIKKILSEEKNIKLDSDDNLELNKTFVRTYINFLKKTGNQIFDSLSIKS